MTTTQTETESFRSATVAEARRAFQWKHKGHGHKIVTARRAVPGDRRSDVVITFKRSR